MPGLRPEPFIEERDTQTVPIRITQAVSNTQKRVIGAGGAWPFVANQAPMRAYQTRRGEVLNASVRSEPFRVFMGEPAEFGKNRTLRFSGHP